MHCNRKGHWVRNFVICPEFLCCIWHTTPSTWRLLLPNPQNVQTQTFRRSCKIPIKIFKSWKRQYRPRFVQLDVYLNKHQLQLDMYLELVLRILALEISCSLFVPPSHRKINCECSMIVDECYQVTCSSIFLAHRSWVARYYHLKLKICLAINSSCSIIPCLQRPAVPVKKKWKGPKNPNPLSCKKKKKSQPLAVNTTEETKKRRRNRKHKKLNNSEIGQTVSIV